MASRWTGQERHNFGWNQRSSTCFFRRPKGVGFTAFRAMAPTKVRDVFLTKDFWKRGSVFFPFPRITGADGVSSPNVCSAFAAVAARFAEAPALVCDSVHITYADLDRALRASGLNCAALDFAKARLSV